MPTILIKNGIIVNEGKTFEGNIVVDGDKIAHLYNNKVEETPPGCYDKTIDAKGCLVLPGVIDSHVHFREPGLTRKADMERESRAAAYGGVTSYFDMPNTVPQTTSPEALEEKFHLAAQKSHVNYSFFYGATNDNVDTFQALDPHRIPGIKLFMGSSTGNMLVDKQEALDNVFATAHRLDLPVMAHCEDTDIINANMEQCKRLHGDDPDVSWHPTIRSEEACYESSRLAAELARKHGTRLHIAHITTARELSLIEPEGNITGEAVIAHLVFTDADYTRLGTRIKCNPAVKTLADRDALRHALTDGRITTVGTDHAPHELKDKVGGAARAASGMPMVQFSLVTMLELVDEGVLSVERMVELTAHNPARLFGVSDRGFLREGYKADIVVVRPHAPWTVTPECIQSKCAWSPMEGHTYRWRVEQTVCNGHVVYDNGSFDAASHGEPIMFRK